MKPIVVMQPGPLHLFWTTGVFYFWSLKERFDFVLVVSETYRHSEQFAKLTTLDSIRHVEYMPVKGIVGRYFNYSRKFKEILQTYSPAYLLTHNCSYIENQYLLYWARRLCPRVTRYYYQNGRMSLIWKEDFAARRAERIKLLVHKCPWLLSFPGLTGELVKLRNSLAFFLIYKMLPLLVCRILFHPPVNVFTGEIDRKATHEQSNTTRDYLLSYLDNEIAVYRGLGIKNILQIRHPLTKCAKDVFTFIHDDYQESDIILVLPSYGFTSRMQESGWRHDNLVKHVADKWCVALEELSKRFPGFEVQMKLHPVAANDPLWKDIITNVLLRIPTLRIIAASESAEWHVVQSRVIVGDVTSVLWWAAMFGGKVVISLDIFDYPGGEELRAYPDLIYYVDNLKRIPIEPLTEDTRKYPSVCNCFFTGE